MSGGSREPLLPPLRRQGRVGEGCLWDQPEPWAPPPSLPLPSQGEGPKQKALGVIPDSGRRGRSPDLRQHSMTLTASPPREVSLYLSCMSRPVSRMVLMTLSSDTLCLPSPRSAMREALIAFTAP